MLEIHLLATAMIIISNDSLKVNDLATATSDNVGERTTNAEGVFSLCAGDRLLVIVSWIYYPIMVSSRLILIRLHHYESCTFKISYTLETEEKWVQPTD